MIILSYCYCSRNGNFVTMKKVWWCIKVEGGGGGKALLALSLVEEHFLRVPLSSISLFINLPDGWSVDELHQGVLVSLLHGGVHRESTSAKRARVRSHGSGKIFFVPVLWLYLMSTVCIVDNCLYSLVNHESSSN